MSNGVIREWFRMESSVVGNGGWLCREATGQWPVCSRQPLAGLRCTHDVSGPGRGFPARARCSGRNIGHRSHPSKNPVLRASRRTAKPFNSPWALSGHQCAFLCRALHFTMNQKWGNRMEVTCSFPSPPFDSRSNTRYGHVEGQPRNEPSPQSMSCVPW